MNIQKAFEELDEKYQELAKKAIDVAFSEYNDDTELLLRCLYKQGLIDRKDDFYYKKKKGW